MSAIDFFNSLLTALLGNIICCIYYDVEHTKYIHDLQIIKDYLTQNVYSPL